MNLGFVVLAVAAGNQLVIQTYTLADGVVTRDPIEHHLSAFLGPERYVKAQLTHLNRSRVFDGSATLASRLMLSPNRRFLYLEQVEREWDVQNGVLDLVQKRATFLPWRSNERTLAVHGEQFCELVTARRGPLESEFGRELIVREVDLATGHQVSKRGMEWVSPQRGLYEERARTLAAALKRQNVFDAITYGDFRAESFGYAAANWRYLSRDGSIAVVWYRNHGVSIKSPSVHVGVAVHEEGWRLKDLGEWHGVTRAERQGEYVFVEGWRRFPGNVTLTVIRHTDGKAVAELPAVGFAIAGLTEASEYLREIRTAADGAE